MSIAWATVEAALQAWFAASTGVTVIWSQQGGPRPSGAHVALRIAGIRRVGQDWLDVLDNPMTVSDVIEAVGVVANTLTLTAHGLTTGDGPVRITNVGGSSAAATGTLTLAANPTDGETVTVGAVTYTWSVTPSVAYEVFIGGDANDSATKLAAAINDDGVAGIDYFPGLVAHPLVTAAVGVGDSVVVTAITPGTAGNAIATTETMAAGSWGAATLTGGSEALPGGLATATDYWVIRVDANTIKLATTFPLALAGTAIDLTATGTGTNTIVSTADTVHIGEEIAHRQRGVREVTLTAQAFAGGATGAASAAALLHAAVSSCRLPTRAAALNTAGIGIASFGPVQSLDGWFAKVFEPRAVLECRFFLSEEVSEFGTFIDYVEVENLTTGVSTYVPEDPLP